MMESKSQHIIPALAILVLSIVVTWISYTQQPAEAFTFPRVIASVMVVLAIWNFARAVLGFAKIGGGVTIKGMTTILPGLMVMLIYILFAAKVLGFYVASMLAFVAIFTLYDPAPHTALMSWVKRLVIAFAFMVVIYGLFALLLKVQTPRGMFF